MSTMIQIRNVPDHVHRVLKARAASDGVTLSDFCLRLLGQLAERPTLAEIRERLERLPPIGVESGGAVEILRAERDRP